MAGNIGKDVFALLHEYEIIQPSFTQIYERYHL